MRDKRGNKPGSLTPEECTAKATELIAEHGICLFIVDLVHSQRIPEDSYIQTYSSFNGFRSRASELFSEHMPENSLAVTNRPERGFAESLGDASWAGIDDASVIAEIVKLKDEEFPELKLHYGVAADAWSPGIELVR